jgi:hypothetical protein
MILRPNQTDSERHLADLEESIRTLPREALPAFLGGLARIEALARLSLSSGSERPAGPEEELLGAEAAARLLGLRNGRAVLRLRDLPRVRVGRKIRFRRKQLERWIKTRESLE